MRRHGFCCIPFGVNVSLMGESCGRARIKRFGKDWYMPHRVDESDRERDQVLLLQMANVSPEQMERDLVVIKKRRKDEMAAMQKSMKENAAASVDAAGSGDSGGSRTVLPGDFLQMDPKRASKRYRACSRSSVFVSIRSNVLE